MNFKAHSCRIPKLKVSIVTRHFSNLGGLEKYGWRISQAFMKRGAKVNILTSDHGAQGGLHPQISVQTFPVKKWLNFRKMEEFDWLCRRWHEKNETDIIFAMDRTSHQTHLRAGNGVHAAFLKRREKMDSRSPLISSLNPLNRTILKIEKAAFENPELKVLFTNSHMVKKEILAYYKTPPEKIQVVHNGVEWLEMEKDFSLWLEKKQSICRELGLDPSRYHFLFVGNGFKRKGLGMLLKGLSLLSFKDFHLSVIGKDKAEKEFIELSEKLGLKNHVSFFGPRSDVRRFYQYSDCLAIPSFYDPFANVTVEALAMGLYVVSSSFNGGHEVLSEDNGTAIKNLFDPESVASSLSRAIMHPKTWIRSKNIRNSVQYLDFSNQLTTLIDLTLET